MIEDPPENAAQAPVERPLTLRAFMGSLGFADVLVLAGWLALVAAGGILHAGLGWGIFGAGLMLIGVRSGMAA